MFNDTPIARFNGPWGVPIEIGATLLILVFILASMGGSPDLYSLTFIVVIVGSIFLHELGHAWGCMVQGVPVERIMLYGGGGFCQHARAPSRREEELIVAMGPIVNIVLWALSSMALGVVEGGILAVTLWQIMVVNLALFALNMLPVQPLDGGKLLHLFLQRFLAPRAATKIAGFCGLIICILWIPGMILVWFYLGFLLLFMPQIGLHWAMFQAK